MPWKVRGKAQKRREPGSMTKTEERYLEILKQRMAAGEIDSYAFEVETFVLAKDSRYTPDFRVVLLDGTVEFHEVKPANWEKIPNQTNSRTKIHVAADLHPYVFRRVVEIPKKLGGGWTSTVIEPR